MPTTISANADLGKTVLQKVIEQYTLKQSSYWKRFCKKTENTSLSVWTYNQEGEFGTAPVVNEATGIPVDSFSTGNKKEMALYKRGLGFDVSTEAMETDQYGVIQKAGPKMAKAFNQTKEYVAHNQFFNTGFTATNVSPDSITLFNSNGLSSGTGHATDDAGTRFNNRGVLSGTTYVDVAFGYFGLELALQEFITAVTKRGLPYPMTGKKILVVPPQLLGVAKRVVGATKMAQSTDNDPNFAGDMIVDVIASPYLTSATAWFLIDVEEMPFFQLLRRGFKTKTKENINLDVMETRVTEIYNFGVYKPQGAWGTSGA